VNIKLNTLDTLGTKVNSFEKDLKRLWLHVEDKTKETNDNSKLHGTISYLQSQS